MNATFNAYSSKSAANKGAQRKGYAGELEQVDGKWGFYSNNEQAARNAAEAGIGQSADDVQEETTQSEDPLDAGATDVSPFVATEVRADGELAAAIEAGIEEAEEESEETPIASSAFGAFAAAQLGAQTQADPVRTQSVVRIEKQREERNGVKRPSAGTSCAAVWDTAFSLSVMSENGTQHERIATLSEVVKAAESKGINKFTARTQYARWRVFHGLTGRLVQK